jgi:hypothetical protein
LSFIRGEIRDLVIEVNFADEGDLATAARALGQLLAQRRRGERTEILSYAACARLTFDLAYAKKTSRLVLPRSGSSRRLLTPGFKERPQPESSERDFDLLQLFHQGSRGPRQDGTSPSIECHRPGTTSRPGGVLSKPPDRGSQLPLVISIMRWSHVRR